MSFYCCNSPIEKSDSKSVLTSDSVSNMVFVDKYINKFLLKDSVIKEINKPIDSTKLIRAFNDIYFGVMDYNFSRQQIGNYNYKTVDENFDKEFGMYQFGLTSDENLSSSQRDDALAEIDQLVTGQYKKQFIINEVGEDRPSDLAIAAQINKENGTVSPEIPSDWGRVIFIKQYETSSKILKVGYQPDYTQIYGTKKVTYLGANSSYDKEIEDKNKVLSFSKGYNIYLQFTYIKALLKRNNIIQNKIKTKKAIDQSKF